MNISLAAGILSGVAEKLRSWMTGWFGAIMSIIPKTIYALCTFIFSLLDILQVLIRKVAGLDQIYYTSADMGTTGAQSGDLVYTFIQNILLGETPILSNVFWAMIILGVIMLFLTTLIAILRSEYAATDSKSASKGKIIGQAFKAILSFAVVPIVAFLGIYLANAILQAVDTITSGTETSIPLDSETGESLFVSKTTANGTETYINYDFYGENLVPTSSTSISGQIFAASAYKANRIRYYTLFQQNISNPNVSAGVFNLVAADLEKASALLDDCFANAYTLKTTQTLEIPESFATDYLYPLGSGSSSFFSNAQVTFNTFDKNNIALVWYYYDLWSFDFIICIATLVVAGKLLVSLVFGLMKRIFEMIILFLIAAPISALMPLDNGAAIGNWRKKFIAKTISAYAPIAGLNLVFIVLPLISTINFFNIPSVDKIVNLLFLLVGLLMVKDLVGTISELIGGEDAMKAGEGMAGQIGGTLASVGKIAVTPARFMTAGAKFAGRSAKYALNKVKQGRDHRAEKGAIIGKLGTEARDDLGGKSELEYFNSTSGHKQRKFLKEARLSMSDKDREAAHDDAKINRKSYRSFKNANALPNYKSPKFYHDKASKKEASKAEEKQKREMLEGAAYQSFINPVGETKGRLIESTDEESKKFKNASLKKQRSMIRNKVDFMSFEDKNRIMDKNDQFHDQNMKGTSEWKEKKRPLEVVKNPHEKYKNFNSRYFGDEDEKEQAIAKRKTKEFDIYGGKKFVSGGLGELGENLRDSLTGIFKTLGGEFSKGWKEAGGFGSIMAQLQGISEKKQSLGAEVKNQKKILNAQREADKLLGGGAKESGGSNKIDISESSAELLAEAIAQKLGRK